MALLNRWQLSPTLIPTGHDLRPETHAILSISLEYHQANNWHVLNGIRTQNNQIKVQRSVLNIKFAMQWFQNVTNQKATFYFEAI